MTTTLLVAPASFFAYFFDLDSDKLNFVPAPHSDFQAYPSQAMGVGILCLLAQHLFVIPWDQLEPFPGRGVRFDYRGRRQGFDGIFEAKGTSHMQNQLGQIEDGLTKKTAHHARGERFDVELIVSTFVGRRNTAPRIVLADPDFDRLARLYDSTGDKFFRLRHYVRVLQFMGLPRSAFALNRFAKYHFSGEGAWSGRILDRGDAVRDLEPLEMGGFRFLGRWFDSIIPPGSGRYDRSPYERLVAARGDSPRYRVFQGLRQDIFDSAFEGQPFSRDLVTASEIQRTLENADRRASVFPDGTILVFELIE